MKSPCYVSVCPPVFVSYAFRVVSKESRRLVAPRISCNKFFFHMLPFKNLNAVKMCFLSKK
jgi:hypothetical protein